MIKIKATRILSALAVCAAMLAPATDVQAQELVKQEHGTVLQQIENLNANLSATPNVDAVLSLAYTFRGVPYRHGASSPKAFDCSGFTSYVFKQFGINLDRTAYAQINNGTRVARTDLKPGDLVFFNGRAISSRIGHVGIVTQVNPDKTFKFIHAASRGVTVSNSTESYYQCRYMGACRIIQ